MAVKFKYAYEFLDAIQKAENDEKRVEMLKLYGGTPPLNFLLSMCYNQSVVFDLPSGMPPYKRDEATHPDLFSPLASQIRKMQICLKSNRATPKYKKEMVFVQLMECVNPKEGDILVACKDRALIELYPAITKELVASALPHFVKD